MPLDVEKLSSDMDREELQDFSNKHNDVESLQRVSEIIEKEKGRIPDAEDIDRMYSYAESRKQVELAKGLTKAAIEESELKHGNLGFATRFTPNETYIDLSQATRTEGKPQVFYGQVMQKRNAGFMGLSSEKYSTDEVVVISRLNNSKNESESSVVITMAKQKDGKPLLEQGNPSLSTIMTEARYQEIVTKDYKDLDKAGRVLKAALSGNQTMAQVADNFNKIYKKPLVQFNTERDESLKNRPEAWRVREEIQDRLDRVEGRYTELLQEVNNKITSIEEEVAEEQKRSNERQRQPNTQESGKTIDELYQESENKVLAQEFVRKSLGDARWQNDAKYFEGALQKLLGEVNAGKIIGRALEDRLKLLESSTRPEDQRRVQQIRALINARSSESEAE